MVSHCSKSAVYFVLYLDLSINVQPNRRLNQELSLSYKLSVRLSEELSLEYINLKAPTRKIERPDKPKMARLPRSGRTFSYGQKINDI